jgi:transposase
MRAYSEDLRERVVEAVDRGIAREEIVRVFGVSLATVKRWLQRRRTTGSVAARRPPGMAAVKTAGLAAALPGRLATHGDATLAEHCAWWAEVSGHRVSVPTLCRAIAALDYTRKKRPSVRRSATR